MEQETKSKTSDEIFKSKNLIYAEFGGNSGGYAFNYGRIIYQKDRLKIAASTGFSLMYGRGNERIFSTYWVPVFPAEITAFFGRSKHHLELGIGLVTYREKQFIFDEDFPRNIRERKYWGVSIVPRVGYRFQKPDGGFFYRVSYTPSINFKNFEGAENKANFFPFGLGISLGISF